MSKVIGREKKTSRDDFDAENEKKTEIRSFGFGVFAKSRMIEKSKNAWRKFQRSHDKHSQNNDA